LRLVLRPLSLVLMALVAGPTWGQPEIREGEATIFKPEGGKAVLVARVRIGQWTAAR